MKTQAQYYTVFQHKKNSSSLNRTIHALAAFVALFFSLSLSSCQKEELVAPQAPAGKNARLSAEGIFQPKLYLLSKQDNIVIKYNDDKVMTAVSFSPYYQVNYITHQSSESSTTITSHASSNGAKVQTNIYVLKEGRIKESITTQFHPQTGGIMKETHYLYQFNAQGKVVKRYNKTNGQERIEFFYNFNGDLTKVTEYSAQGSLLKTTQYFYTATALADKYGFYPEITGIDPFLKVLGVFFKKLPTSILIDYASSNQSDAFLKYEYELDSYGYPLKRNTYKNVFPTPQFLSARTYDYLKFNIALK
jgi:hypothetical protein